MIKIENTETYGWGAAIRGSLSYYERDVFGEADLFAAAAVDDHGKLLRMITVTADITAPLYWWKEYDAYKVGTVTNSCSITHRIHDKEFTLDDFSYEHLETIARFLKDDDEHEPYQPYMLMKYIVKCLNACRDRYLVTKDKTDWWQMIQLLPSSYNQKYTVQLNYAVLKNIYYSRKNHILDEWHEFCEWIEHLPYSILITGDDGTQ